ncbi:MAG TPA: FBP domain-containing protein [Actinospica sp.]|nr:FBP domain-containing protein [Actinospica sp.]
MRPVTEPEIRACFINCSKGEAQRLNLPRDFAEQQPAWPDLDYLGWRDPGAPDRAYLVADREGLIGISLRTASSGGRGFTARSICTLCKTTRTGGGVALLTARRAGESGRNGNTVGQYICSDLACSLYVRGEKTSAGTLLDETLDTPTRIARLEKGLDAFLAKITA